MAITKAPGAPNQTAGGALPNLIIIGAAKCGTTSLHEYLRRHPMIHMSRKKELSFFGMDGTFSKGLDWYASHFRCDKPVNGESSTLYTRFPRFADAPRLMYETLPNAKLIYLVRDPIDRIISYYIEMVDQLRERRPFDQVIKDIAREEESYVSASKYHMQLSRYLQYFEQNQIMIIDTYDFRNKTTAILAEVVEFIGLPSVEWNTNYPLYNCGDMKKKISPLGAAVVSHATVNRLRASRRIHWRVKSAINTLLKVGGATIPRPRLSPDDEDRLMDLFRDDVAKLRALTGRRFAEWRNY